VSCFVVLAVAAAAAVGEFQRQIGCLWVFIGSLVDYSKAITMSIACCECHCPTLLYQEHRRLGWWWRRHCLLQIIMVVVVWHGLTQTRLNDMESCLQDALLLDSLQYQKTRHYEIGRNDIQGASGFQIIDPKGCMSITTMQRHRHERKFCLDFRFRQSLRSSDSGVFRNGRFLWANENAPRDET
jgi:hypothetical protein